MSSSEETIDAACCIDGVLAVALVDWRDEVCVASRSSGEITEIERVALKMVDTVRAKQTSLGEDVSSGQIHDILVTLDEHYHIVTPVSGTTTFLYTILSRALANLAMARIEIGETMRRHSS